ncbi:MAG: hypothetical protein GXP49_05350 [Deltaproteobacteria bacterium]|nr:hypothetical protein [Deltaproteobacteria bacterium]
MGNKYFSKILFLIVSLIFVSSGCKEGTISNSGNEEPPAETTGADAEKELLDATDLAGFDHDASLDYIDAKEQSSDEASAEQAGTDRDVDFEENGTKKACQPLEKPTGKVVTVGPGQAGDLRSIVASAGQGTTIVLKDGLYLMDKGDNQSRLSFNVPGVTLRSESGDPGAVVLDGGYVTGELVSIAASNVTIAELTLKRAYYHPIHITGTPDGNTISGVRIYRVRVIDPAEQGIKINPSSAGGFVDQGTVECCHIELTGQGQKHVRNNCYTGGVDAHQARGWTIRSNTIIGFWCSQGLSEHGVHFWTGSRDTLVERNTILDCARGIGFGLGENGAERHYKDNPYAGVGYIGHYDGIIRNNFIAAFSNDLFASSSGFDSGIGLEQARGAKVVHNTIVSYKPPFSSIEWRFDNTLVLIANNLVSHNLRDRGGTATLKGNIAEAKLDWFQSPASGDLHIKAGVPPVDAGILLEPGLCDKDIDGQERDPAPDVGADELQ